MMQFVWTVGLLEIQFIPSIANFMLIGFKSPNMLCFLPINYYLDFLSYCLSDYRYYEFAQAFHIFFDRFCWNIS